MSLATSSRAEVIEQFRRSATDSGSSDVQIALLTQRINMLTDHMRSNTKDYASRRVCCEWLAADVRFSITSVSTIQIAILI